MNKNQFFRLSLVLIAPLFLIGYFLASSSQLNPKNFFTFCDFSNGHCYSQLKSDDYNHYEFIKSDLYDHSIYLPGEPNKHKVFIKNTLWILRKKQQTYPLKDYGSIQAIEQAFDNGDEGISTPLVTNNLLGVETPCYFSRHKGTNLFLINTTGHQNSACPGNFYFKPFIGDLNKLNSIDGHTTRYYRWLKTEIYIKSIILFLAPFFVYIFLVLFIILIKRIRSFVISGSFKRN